MIDPPAGRRVTRSKLAFAFALGLGIVVLAVALRSRRPEPQPAAPDGASQVPFSDRDGVPSSVPRPSAAGARGQVVDSGAAVVASLPWGSGPGQITRATDEGDPDGSLRLAIDPDGSLVLLDRGGGRLVRIRPDGKPGDVVPLSTEHPRDLFVSKGGVVAVLDVGDKSGSIVLLSGSGGRRGALPVPDAPHARGVLVVGDDVYAESSRGVLTRIGDVFGAADPSPTSVPGRPTRDGRGFVSALIADPQIGSIHVFVIDQSPRKQRFSRVLRGGIPALGIFLVEDGPDGTVYVGITSSDAAELLCLDSENGHLTGIAELPVNLGEEAIVDAKTVEGGVVVGVSTPTGIRLERHDCRAR